MNRRSSDVASSCCAATFAPCTLSVYRSTIHGAATTPTTVIAASATIATVKIALAASSSRVSKCLTNSGTSVAVSTPPSSSS